MLFRLPSEEELTDNKLNEFIAKHNAECAFRFKHLKDAYETDYQIFHQKPKPNYKPDNRIAVNFAKYMVDGTVRTPGTAEVEITASSLLKKGDKFIDELEAALDDDEKMEIWEVNLAEPQESSSNKFKAKYFQGYLTEIDKTSNAEDNVELSLTFGLEGKGVDGYATVTAEQQEVAAYVFADTQKTGA